MEEVTGYNDGKAIVAAASGFLKNFSNITYQAPSAELASLAGELAELAALAQAALVQVTAEAETRGVVALSQAKNTTAWVADAAWHVKTTCSATIAKAAAISKKPEFADIWDCIKATDLAVPVAVTVADQYCKIRKLFKTDDIRSTVLKQLIDAGAEYGSRQVRALAREVVARYSPDTFEEEEDKATRRMSLTSGAASGDTWYYELTLDAEHHAILEAAIGPLSAPITGPNGETDERPVALRRAQALMTVLTRGVGSAEQLTAQPKTMLTLTMNFRDLKDQVGAGTTTGALGYGNKLTPTTIRKHACQAGILPTVLGSSGEVLDQGRTVRLFTPAQEAALRERDRKCTFPGCDTPAKWSEKHHLVHWIDGGTTDLDNGCLLCQRHHTIVHRDELAGQLIDNQVVWDLTPGSYQELLQTLRQQGKLPTPHTRNPQLHSDHPFSGQTRPAGDSRCDHPAVAVNG